MRVPTLRCASVRGGPALEKYADARCDGDFSVPTGIFHSAGHKRISAFSQVALLSDFEGGSCKSEKNPLRFCAGETSC